MNENIEKKLGEDLAETSINDLKEKFENDKVYKEKVLGVLNNFQIYDGGCDYLFCTKEGKLFPFKQKIENPEVDVLYIGKDMSESEKDEAIEVILKAIKQGTVEIFL